MEVADPKDRTYSVCELTYRIRDLLEGEVGEVWVEGEISNFKAHTSGHCYFTLKDEQAQISAVMFRGDVARLGFVPEDGQRVAVYGMVTVYAPRGNYQIRATRMVPKGAGNLQEQFERLKRKLAEEGLFEEGRKRRLPVFPEKVGIITSPTGAALRDFLNIVRRRCPRLAVQVFGVHVQGREAAGEIVFAVEELNRRGEVDVIVLARGGGSLEDLWSFNEEAVARAVAVSEIPTVSAVGHEVDFTICDFVADLRAPTPSAAAELVSEADEVWFERLEKLAAQASRACENRVKEQRWRWKHLAEHYVFREPRRVVEIYSQKLDEIGERLKIALETQAQKKKERFEVLNQRWRRMSPEGELKARREKLEVFENQLRMLSPEATVKRGYAMVLDAQGGLIKRKAQAESQEELEIRLSDGAVRVKPVKAGLA